MLKQSDGMKGLMSKGYVLAILRAIRRLGAIQIASVLA